MMGKEIRTPAERTDPELLNRLKLNNLNDVRHFKHTFRTELLLHPAALVFCMHVLPAVEGGGKHVLTLHESPKVRLGGAGGRMLVDNRL